ncbi:hypothetical protein PF008_g19227 [Phytophthora fragariae]|uniref:Uncharacterized protein n=1 Tax=Phytophthora fragariae TaxID=53985 RepID=A0A6G0R436_9STRA|nr:hypothetical protein PF008_g19227 [Phytophthora fragariae]
MKCLRAVRKETTTHVGCAAWWFWSCFCLTLDPARGMITGVPPCTTWWAIYAFGSCRSLLISRVISLWPSSCVLYWV